MGQQGKSSSLFSRLLSPLVKGKTPQPTSNDRTVLHASWTAQGQSWRTEPEINKRRQAELAQCRAIVPDVEKGIYPFKGMKLNRADIEWLLATHESQGICGPVDWNDETQRKREGLDLRGADLRPLGLQQVDLHGLPLARLRGNISFRDMGKSTKEEQDASATLMQKINFFKAHLEGADFRGAHLENALFAGAYLESANLFGAHLADAHFGGAHLERANLTGAHLENTDLGGAFLRGANLSIAHLEGASLVLCQSKIER